jgi:hypothetical protein
MSTEPKKMLTLSCAPVAERMRRYRKRRRGGRRCVRVEVNLAEVEALIRKGYLNDETPNDQDALAFAVGCFIYDALTAEA